MKRISIDKLLSDLNLQKEFFADMKNGAIAVIPTDTLYGFAVDSSSSEAVAKIYRIKSRSEKKPLILFLGDLNQLDKINITPDQKQKSILQKYWPGALTAVFNFKPTSGLSAFTYQTIGVRVPGHLKLLDLLKAYPGMFLTTSANRSGLPSDKNPDVIFSEFSDEIDWFIDDGCMNEAIASTVLDMTCEPFKVLRAGSVVPQL
jgi:L-threonylcarbamoyladenylate synthase